MSAQGEGYKKPLVVTCLALLGTLAQRPHFVSDMQPVRFKKVVSSQKAVLCCEMNSVDLTDWILYRLEREKVPQLHLSSCFSGETPQ